MLDNWHQFLTRAHGMTIPTLCQLAQAYPSADATINPQKRIFETNRNNTWQVFIDHPGSAPIPNMCCRWHLNGKCVKNCFSAASHVQLDDTQIEAVKAWIEKCRARMPRLSAGACGTKKKIRSF